MTTGKHKVAFSCLLLLACVLFLGASSPAPAQDNLGKIVNESILSQKKKRSYYLFVPAGLTAPAPLIVLLHGSGRNGLSLVEKWKDLAAKEGFIVVGPDADSGGGWSAPRDGPDFLHDLVEALKTKYSIDPRRVYLFGHSAGAVFALMMSTVESEYFAATAIHAGAFRTREEYQTIGNATRKIPLAIWVGTVDPFFHLADVRATRDAFRSAGFTVEVTEMPGHDHWYYDLAPGINQSAWQFLKKYELPSGPRYAEYSAPGVAGDANKMIGEINSLNTRAKEAVDQSNDKERELGRKDFAVERSEVIKLAQSQIALFEESAMLWRAAAEKADAASQLKLPAKQKEYLRLIAQFNRKWAEVMDAMRERAEALLGTESLEAIETKRNAAQTRADKLHQQADALQDAIDKLMH
jgi:poly(3-hydroxybutyrate) depolymerase